MPEPEDLSVDDETKELTYLGKKLVTDEEIGRALHTAVMRYGEAEAAMRPRNYAGHDLARRRFDDLLWLAGAAWGRLGSRPNDTTKGEPR